MSVLLLVGLLCVPPTMVLPPAGPDGEAAWVAEAVADALPRSLLRLGVPVVESADRLRAHESLEIPAQSLTRATSVRIAEALGATRIVLGSYDLKGEALSLSLRILDVERGSLSAPLIAGGPVEAIQTMLRGLAWDIATAGPAPPSLARQEFVDAAPAVPFAALRSLARGLAAPDAASRQRLLKLALQQHPGYDEARLALGRLHVETRDNAAAVTTLSGVQEGSPMARSARFLQGVASLELGRFRDAVALFSALALPEPTATVLNNYALALLRAGPTPEGVRASDVLRKAMDLDPTLEPLPMNLGWALYLEGDSEAGSFWLRGALRHDPGNTHARVALVWALRASGREQEADTEWKALLARAPGYSTLATPDPKKRFERPIPWERPIAFDEERWGDRQYAASHLGRGEKLYEAKDLDGARREWSQAAYLDPYSDRAHLLLARLSKQQGHREQAASELRMALWIRDDLAVRLELMHLLADMGRRPEARAEAERVLKADARNPDARALLGKK